VLGLEQPPLRLDLKYASPVDDLLYARWQMGLSLRFMVALGGALSGAFVVTANAWMNTPTGFLLADGKIVHVDPVRAMFNPAAGAPARLAAASHVAFIVWGWALAQYPYAVRPHLVVADTAAPVNVLALLLQVLGVGAVILLPSLLYLFGIFGPRGSHGHDVSPLPDARIARMPREGRNGMARLVFGMNQSLDGYVDHTAFAPRLAYVPA
jgi:hypothetical protein